MSPSCEFDVAHSALGEGVTVIEASAGTGKTFAIAGIWLRLLLEHELPHDQILVVTYTDAAAVELRDRIHHRIEEAVRAVAIGTTDDPFLSAVLARCRRSDPDWKATALRLAEAQADFDESPIGTIHGFCHRVQRSRAFETASPFSTELNPDTRLRNRELIRDWWQLRLAEAPRVLVAWAARSRISVEQLDPLLKELEQRPGIQRLCGAPGSRLLSYAGQMVEGLARLRSQWSRSRAQLRPFLVERSGWVGNRGEGVRTFKAQGRALEACLDGDDGFEGLMELWNFSDEKVRQHARNPDTLDLQSPWMLERCSLEAAAKAWSSAWPAAFLDWAEQEIPRRQREVRQCSYTDLLTRVRDALRGPGGSPFAAAIRSEFSAVLVDEFQDTDPVQWEIFRSLFVCPGHRLFLVGDPKQSIYGFRGADIHTYLEAVQLADQRCTLGTNWRSGGTLVRQINGFWSRIERPFVVPGIEFRPIRPALSREGLAVIEADGPVASFQVWTLPAGENKPAAISDGQMAEGVAGEVSRLLHGGANLESRPLRASDIAVLGESRQQLESVARALIRCGIPVVLPTRKNVLKSAEASEFQRFLAGLEETGRDPLLRGALATDLVGLDAATLLRLNQSEPEWVGWLDRVEIWRSIWLAHGPLALFRYVAGACRSSARWLAASDGERRLTNYLQIAELLQRAARTGALGPSGQIEWLDAEMNASDDADPDALVRLERDDSAVQLLTLHGSKGLEFPVVFCPFWKKSAVPTGQWIAMEQVIFHAQGTTSESRWDLGTTEMESHRVAARVERLSENLRLLYVGMTRASRLLYLGWSSGDKPGTALGWWSTGHSQSSPEAWIQQGGKETASDLSQLREWARSVGAVVREVPPPEAGLGPVSSPVADEPTPRKFHGEISRRWRLVSFSSLTADNHDVPVDRDPNFIADFDEGGLNTQAGVAPASLHAFPRGRTAGIVLHRIFELWCAGKLLGPSPASDMEALLLDAGIEAQFAPAIVGLLEEVNRAPLTQGASPLRFAESHAEERVVELEFCLQLVPFTSAELAEVLNRHSAELPPGLVAGAATPSFPPVEGVLRGFIDLVFRARDRFWVVDWKSNALGWSSSDYDAVAMAGEMASRAYYLQLLLYTIAVDRWLALRLPGYSYEHHFGGVHYLFVRGLDARVPGQGVFSLRPSAGLVQDLTTLLVGTREVRS